MLRRTFLMLVAVLSAAAPAAAQVKLEQKYAPRTSFKQQLTVQTNQTLVGQATSSDVKGNTLFTYGPRTTDGSVNVSEKAEALSFTIKSAQIELKFDSADPATFKSQDSNVQFILDIIKKQLDAVIEYSIAGGQVGEIKGLAEGSLQNPEDERLRRQQSIARIPAEEVKPGQSWERTAEIAVGAGQTISTTRKYTYVGSVDKFATVKGGKQLHKIEFTDADVKFFIKPNRGFPGEVKNCDLKASETKGTLLFDADLGRVVQSDSLLHIVGNVDLDVMGTKIAGPLDLKIVATSKEL